ncbi:PAAR domain-containing protein [Pseudomonas fluorescens]|uniref:PAAR domain-containing protein n=1 Tax=Pseudomonas fluorescens TaxID=294 RepID=A0A5E7E0Z2_PSEFL|nr:PAAR domain-containing protein [Pseudomonas fluorescens]VVO15292.1 hypothetical protein PS691_03746 [Pseudomonas fluorescens]
MRRYHITVGAKTTVDGTVRTGWEYSTINGLAMAREGDEVYCPECDSTGEIACDGPHLVDLLDGRHAALDGDLCRCKCDPPPRLIANQTLRCQEIEGGGAVPRPRAAAQPAATTSTHRSVAESRSSGFTPAPSHRTPTFSELPGRICENLWRGYQQRAEAIVAPSGTLIADPKARNRAINAAYAGLWLEDQRFQWAGLAAFASKQVGCGLLHAADSIDKVQAEYEAGQRLRNSARKGFFGLFSRSERDRQAKLREFEQTQRDYEQAYRNNPLPSIDLGRDDESLSYAQQLYQYVYEMLAMGNTTLFLDVFPLHAFYQERGLQALKTCLPSRKNIYGHDQHPLLWPVGQKKLRFGNNYEEILQAFEAIEAGNIAESVEHLAWHEQRNILQPAMYSDRGLEWLLRSNHVSYVIGFPSGAAEAIELTLASQCRRVDDERTIGFGNNAMADLSDIHQRMPFVLKAAARFDVLLHDSNRYQIEQAIQDIATGRGVR